MVAPNARAQRTSRHVKLLTSIGIKVKPGSAVEQAQPITIELDYQRALNALLSRATAKFASTVLTALPVLVRDGDGERARGIVATAYARMVGALSPQAVAELAVRFGRQTTDFSREQLARQIESKLGVPIRPPDDSIPKLLRNFVAENMSVVLDVAEKLSGDVEKMITRSLARVRVDSVRMDGKADKNVDLIQNLPPGVDRDELAAAIESAHAGGEMTKSLADQLEKRFSFTADRATMIARDQIGKLNGQASASRQQELGVRTFIWRTMKDERVRPEHEDREGEEYSYDDPPDGELPGEPPLCRCYPEPVFAGILGDDGEELDLPEP